MDDGSHTDVPLLSQVERVRHVHVDHERRYCRIFCDRLVGHCSIHDRPAVMDWIAKMHSVGPTFSLPLHKLAANFARSFART